MLWSADRPVREVESEFAREVQVRSQRMQQMQEQVQVAVVNIAITSLCPLPAGEVLYALESDAVSGVFQFDPVRDRENRWFHNAHY
ncbi:hypothetical protein IQ266_07760 [filamentous cyanobacterium LEGE 11480]|uniref:Uncharacterized protein n=1 Tax=Romeriopsis navalis LEGE 11480 TaxID=2777977 RepID=A0A928VJ77_9CYAN|nr:hypothetical protein [Romeriopsis navalis]MBE9029623.1 hypothetical protein [Romeriopsis navalis LEGE 11480]